MSILVCDRCSELFEAKRSDAKYCSVCRANRKEYMRRYDKRRLSQCRTCGNPTGSRSMDCLPCANRLRKGRLSGLENPNWRGGATMHGGYRYIRSGGKYVAEHRYVWEQANGPLPTGGIIHHRNGVKDDNRLENLELTTRAKHHTHEREAALRIQVLVLEAEVAALRQQLDATAPTS